MLSTIRFRLLLIFTVCAAAIAVAQKAQFSLIQPRNVVQGQRFALTFRLVDGEANPPQAPELDNCSLLYGPSTSTMQSTSIVNGRMSSTYSTDYTFTYRANSAGRVQVPSVSVSVQGQTISTQPTSFNILPSDSDPGAAQQGGVAQQRPSQPQSQSAGNISADDLLVRVFFSKNTVYEQEPVVATIKVYTVHDISSFLPTTQPAFEGFLTEELPVSLETNLENYNGRNYHTAVLKRLLLYPQKPGTLTVNSGKYDVTIVQQEVVNMGFFRTYRPVERNITTSSNVASLTVRPLPEPRPAGFNGAVGQFKVSTSLTPELLKTNEAATYSYTVKGTGNIKFLSEPVVDFPAGVDVYTPKTDIDARVAGADMTGTYTTDFTIVPQEQGQLTIPGTPFVYFDPHSGQYVTLETETYSVKVARGASTSVVSEQTALATEIKDIRHIHPTSNTRGRFIVDYVVADWWYWTIYVVLVAALGAVVFIYRRHIRLEADVTGRRLARASRVANKRLREARKYMTEHRNEEFYGALAKALWGYVSDKLSIAPSQLMRDNIAERLESFGASPEAVANVLEVLDECEMARFTPAHSDSEVARLYDRAVSAINGIENVKRRPGKQV